MGKKIWTLQEVAVKLGLRREHYADNWIGANPIEDGAVLDGFVLYGDPKAPVYGAAYDRKLNKKYTRIQVAQTAGLQLDEYEPLLSEHEEGTGRVILITGPTQTFSVVDSEAAMPTPATLRDIALVAWEQAQEVKTDQETEAQAAQAEQQFVVANNNFKRVFGIQLNRDQVAPDFTAMPQGHCRASFMKSSTFAQVSATRWKSEPLAKYADAISGVTSRVRRS